MIHSLDWVVLIIYALAVLGLGTWASRGQSSTEEYFLAGRSMKWFPVCISIYATSASALTFIGVPGAAYGGDFNYLQLGIGDFIGRLLIAWLFLTAYYKGNVTTVYELLGQRFGPASQTAGTGFFIVTRLLASGVRLAACAIALAVVFEIPLNTAVVMIAITAVIYTVLGGIRAVIWTDMLQFFLFIGGATLVFGIIIYRLPEGFDQFMSIGNQFDKFKIFHFSLSLTEPKSFIAGTLFGAFTTFAALGTDQDLVQRMLTCSKVKESQKAIIWTAVLNIPITLLFLSVGAALFAYYNVYPSPHVEALSSTGHSDYIFPHFIKNVLAPGIRGLLIAGLLAAAMSSLDSALNSLSSTAYIDIYSRLAGQPASPREAVKISRILLVLFAGLLTIIAIWFGAKSDSILWLGFRIVGYTYGALLGIFLLAVTTQRPASDWGNVFAMVSSVMVVIFLTVKSAGILEPLRTALLSPLGITAIAWPWAIIIGTFWTFIVATLLFPKKP